MRYFIILLCVSVSLAFAACGQTGQQTADAPAPTTPGIAPTGSNVNAASCQVGQVYNQQYGCLNRNSCDYGFGWVPGEALCVPGTVIDNQSQFGSSFSTRFYGSLAINDATKFAKMLQYAGLCDPMTVGWNWGSWNCQSWIQRGGFIEMQSFGSVTNPTSANFFIGAGTSWSGDYSYQINQYSQYIGFSQQAKVVAYNSSAGMQVIALGDLGIRLVIANGHMTDQSFSGELWFQNAKIATVTLTRY